MCLKMKSWKVLGVLIKYSKNAVFIDICGSCNSDLFKGLVVFLFHQLLSKFIFLFPDFMVLDSFFVLLCITLRFYKYLHISIFSFRISNFESFLKIFLINEKADIPRFLEKTTWKELAPEEKVLYVHLLPTFLYR